MNQIINSTIVDSNTHPGYIFFSDVHGNQNTLTLLNNAIKNHPDYMLVGGGDYIDGRKNSKKVLDWIISRQEKCPNKTIILRGNHEQMLLNFADGLDIYELGMEPLWYSNGGKKTVRSILGRGYNKELTSHLIKNSKYYAFISSLPIMYETPNAIFVHAGVKLIKNYNDPSIYKGNPFDPNHNSYNFYRMWTRKEYIDNADGFIAHNETGKTIITGHTPTSLIVKEGLTNNLFDDGYHLPIMPFTQNKVTVIQYPDEKARIFTDGGSHSNYTKNWGNVTVFDSDMNIQEVYDSGHKSGINWYSYGLVKRLVDIK